MKIIILYLFTIIIISQTFAQPYQWWSSRYSSPSPGSQDTSSCAAVDNSGNLYIAGWCNGFNTGSDMILLKLNSVTGDTMWVKRYNGTASGEDKALDIITDAAGFIYVTGFTFNLSRDIITIKYDASGNVIWSALYNGANNGGDYGFTITADALGNIYVAGRSDLNNNQLFTVIKYSPSGSQIWAAVYSGPLSQSFDEARDIAADNNGNVYVTGYTTVLQDFHTSDYLTLKYNSSGTLQWAKRYNGTGNDEDAAVRIAAIGNDIFVTGRSDSMNGNYNFCTIKYSGSNGDVLARSEYTGTALRQIDNAVCMSTDNSGNLYITGVSYGVNNSFDYATVKYNTDLQLLWSSRYEGAGSDIPVNIRVTGSSVIVTGTSEGSNGMDLLTVKYDTQGMQMWETRFNGPAGGNDFSAALAVDQFENVFVTGFAVVSASENDIFTLRYSAIPIGIQPVSGSVPRYFNLYQNYPNPFNPSTSFRIDIPAGGGSNTKLEIYDVLGRKITTLINENLKPGTYIVNWNASGFSSGVFFYRLTSGNFTKTNKMIMVE